MTTCTAGPKPKKSEGWQAHLDYINRQGSCNCRRCNTDPGDGRIIQREEVIVARDRAETEPCQKGTEGCCVDHDAGGETCETW